MSTWMRFLLATAIAGSATGCTIQEAPSELSELNRFLYREWGSQDTELLAAGLANFDEVLADVDLEGPLGDRSFLPTRLSEDDVRDHERPDRPLENLLGVSVAHLSPWATGDHAQLIVTEDQTPVQPTAPRYQRTFTGDSDPECFLSRSCTMLTTSNDIRRENILMSVDFTSFKDYRWVQLGDAGDDSSRWAIVSRSWFTESFTADSGNAVLWQSHTLDAWLDLPTGGLLRYQSSWSETEIPGVTDPDVYRGTIRVSLDNTYEAEDDFLGELLEPR